jgi:hypothetical protein
MNSLSVMHAGPVVRAVPRRVFARLKAGGENRITLTSSSVPRSALERTSVAALRKQSIVFLLDDCIALATSQLKALAVEHGDAAADIANQPGLL